jgi:aquaporin Z
MKKYVTEFIGTFFLVLTVGMCVMQPAVGMFAPLAIGSALMIMVYAGGHVSGGHYNPAVTFAVWIRGRCPAWEMPIYWIAQIIGACLASAVAIYLTGGPAASPGDLNIVHALLAEFIGTFALAYVVLNTAAAKATAGNSNYGLAIGFTVMTMAFAFGGISGGAFNPAVATGITIMRLTKVTNFWMYLLGDLAGGGLAAMTFKMINPEDK